MFWYGILIALITLAVDQATKVWALNFFECCDYTYGVTSFFNIVLVFNPGISFGLFSNLSYGPYILTTLSIVIIIFLIYWLFTSNRLFTILALGNIIGGAIGNVIDRVRLGAVVDFLDFHVNNYHWPAFNIADSVIFIGAALLLYDIFLESKEGK